MRKTFYILSLLLVLFVGCQSEERALYSKLTKMASELNESTPVMLDQYTRFDGASVLPGNIFHINILYSILITPILWCKKAWSRFVVILRTSCPRIHNLLFSEKTMWFLSMFT